MDTLLLLVKIELLLLCTSGTAETNDFVKSGTPLSKDEASRRCTDNGSRLVDYSEIQTTIEPQIKQLLANGESVWINGYAKFSSFLAEHGCFKTPKYRLEVTSYILQNANIYSCLTKCLRDKQNASYIGIENKYCVCFDKEDRKSVTEDIVDSSLCNIRCSYFAIGFCGGLKYMNLYRIIDESQIVWANHQPLPRQCVYVQLRNENNEGRFSVSSSSCFTDDLVDGYICTNSVFSTLNTDNCYRYSRNFCLVKKKATRLEAFNDCLNKNGTLVEYFGEAISASLMAYDQRYWIGVFRTFQPSHRIFSKGMACIAVRKVSGKIYLEPDSCMTKKRYVCRRDNKSTSGVSKTVSDKMLLPPNKDNSTTELVETTIQWSVIDKKVPGKGYSSTINRPKSTLNPLLASTVHTMNIKSETYTTESISTDGKRIALSSERDIFNHLSTVAVSPNMNTSNQSKNDISVIVYILPSSLLLLGIIPVIIGLVIYIRKIKQQNKTKRRSQSNPRIDDVRSSDTDHNISTQYAESFHPNVYQNAERILNPKDRNFKTKNLLDDQYDKIEFDEIKPKVCVDTNQYDHDMHGTENIYYDIEDTRPPSMCSIAKDITHFTIINRTEDEMTSAVQLDAENTVSQYKETAYCHLMQTEEQHIYGKSFEENNV